MTVAPSAYTLAGDVGVTDLWWPYGPTVGRYTFKTTAEQTEGRLAQLLIRDNRGAATPLHVHRDADETFYVINGEATIVIGDQRVEARSGDFVFGPRDVPHGFVVTSEQIEMLVTYAGAGTDGRLGAGVHGFFQEVTTPVVAGEAPPEPAMPDTETFARLMDLYGIELVGPPPLP